MKTREDFKPDLNFTLRDLIQDEIQAEAVDKKEPPPNLSDESIEALMQTVYGRIERGALEAYKSAEGWALRRWCLENILKDEIVSEATVEIADGLISPVKDWQREQVFDPISYYKHRLTHTLRRSPATIRAYTQTAARFVGKFGRKKDYSDDEVIQYLDWAGEHYKNCQTSYVHECQRLLQFLRNLPLADRKRELPIRMPQMPDEFRQPMWTDDEVEIFGWACVLDKVKPDMVTRIAIASIYGGRKSELAQLSSDDIHLDGEQSYIYISTLKRGVRKKQPLPPPLIPLFSVPIVPISPTVLHNRLKVIAKRASVFWKPGSGTHSFRRNVVTLLDSMGTQSDISIHKFMRWATPRHLGMLDRYRRTPTEESDMKILNNHPRVKLWEEIIPYLFQFNPHYHSLIDIIQY